MTGSSGGLTWNGFPQSGNGMCHVETAWMDNLDFRVHGSVPIKGGFNGSFIFRNTRGAKQDATLTVAATSANIVFKNGRASSTLTTPAVGVDPHAQPGVWSPLQSARSRDQQVGWSGLGQLRLAFDLYNALNSNSIQNVTTTYGARWLRPTTFLDPRLARVTAAIQF